MISRREFIKALVAGTVLLPLKKVYASRTDERILSMHNIHTNEKLDIKYYSSGMYDGNALETINHFLRCHYTNEVKEIDVKVIDLLCSVKNSVDKCKQIQIISGYRSPAYNAFLVSLGRNVSPNSLHQQGVAIDFSIDGVNSNRLYGIAKSFEMGGVGKYPEFVHIDVGRIRYW